VDGNTKQPGAEVAVLCASGRSIYHHLPNTLVYDKRRDACQFAGRQPVVAHPPCRTWSKFLRTQAKPLDLRAEQELAFLCLRHVEANGGVLEQPYGSHFFTEAALPMPMRPAEAFAYTIEVEQRWWGYCTPKRTWLYIVGVPRHQLPPIPFSLVGDTCHITRLSSAGRSRTVRPFAEWLCQVARATWWQHRK
jgi:hypothetical protein